LINDHVNRHEPGDCPNGPGLVVLNHHIEDKMSKTAKQDHPTPQQIQGTVFAELVLCLIDHLMDDAEALLFGKGFLHGRKFYLIRL
jgi:hypothetical protein